MVLAESGQVLSGRHCAVAGSPIAHSLSPALHRAGYAALGLDWTFEAIELRDAAELNAFLASRDEFWRGLSLTMPLKESVIHRASFDDLVLQAGCANTAIIHHPEGRPVAVELTNTDVLGFVDVLAGRVRPTTPLTPQHAVILGGGATARAAFVALARSGAQQVTVMARTPERTRPWTSVAKKFGVTLDVRPWGAPPPSDLVISAVTAGVADQLAEEVVASTGAVFDVIYHPWPTRLAQVAQDAGIVTFSGLDLLVGQAVHQFTLMTGQPIGADLLLSAGQEELRARGDL